VLIAIAVVPIALIAAGDVTGNTQSARRHVDGDGFCCWLDIVIIPVLHCESKRDLYTFAHNFGRC